MILKDARDSLRMFSVLLRDEGEVADLIFVVGLQILQRLLEVDGHFCR